MTYRMSDESAVGTSGWNYPTGKGTWNGIFYPEGASESKRAEEASTTSRFTPSTSTPSK